MQEIALPHQQKVVCLVVPPLVLHCVCCCAVSPDCPPYSTTAAPRTNPTVLQGLQPTAASHGLPLGLWAAPNADIAARSGRGGTYTMLSHDSHVTSSKALCGPPVHPDVLSDQYWDMRLSGLTTSLCLLFLLFALLTWCSVCPCTTCVHIRVNLPR